VVVKGATAQITDLINLVDGFHLTSSLERALDVKLNAARTAVTAGSTGTACGDLSDFIGQVRAKINKGITPTQANQLIAAALQVQAVLGC